MEGGSVAGDGKMKRRDWKKEKIKSKWGKTSKKYYIQYISLNYFSSDICIIKSDYERMIEKNFRYLSSNSMFSIFWYNSS